MTVSQLSPLTLWGGGFLLGLLLLFFLILYLRGTFRTELNYRLEEVPGFDEPHFPLAMMGVSASVLTQGKPENFCFDIEEIYATRLEAIRRAQRTIHIETFYMTRGRRIQELAEALIERSQAGVEVLFIVDSLGAFFIPHEYWQRLRLGGVKVRFFHQLNWRTPRKYNIRTHRKMILIDGEKALIGGTGVSDCWDGMEETGDLEPWLDTEICFTGAIVATLEAIFMQHWIYVGGVGRLSSEIFKTNLSGGTTVLVTPRNSPSARSSIYGLFYTNVLAAKERIWIASPYFLPDKHSRKALLKAQQNGVDVRIVTVGPHNDKHLVYYAVREGYDDFLKGGIEINEYNPSMMHAKVLLIDDAYVSTGSANFDPRSLFHNDELHLSLVEPQLARQVEHFFLTAFAKSRRIDMKHWVRRPLWQRLLGQVTLFFRWQL